jgi:16S rRNA processing protein RimM
MTDSKYISVGKIGKPHGLSGAFRFLLNRELKNRKKFPFHFMLETKGTYIPWFVKNVDWTAANEGIVLFEEINGPEKAKQFAGSELWVMEKDLNAFFKKETQSIDYLLGYKATDEAFGELGIVQEILESPGQILLSIRNTKKEILVPLVEEFIVTINKRKKEIIFNLPEGLIDL